MESAANMKQLQMKPTNQRRNLVSVLKKKEENSEDNEISSTPQSAREYNLQSPKHLPSVLKKNVPHSPRLMVIDEGKKMTDDFSHLDSKKSSGSPRKMHVHFSNTLEVVHDIHDSSTDQSTSSHDSKPTPSEYSSDFERTESNTEKSSYGKYSSDFDSSTLSGKYTSDFETASDNSQTVQSASLDQETSDLATFSDLTDNSDSTRTYSDSDSYTESLYSDISSLEEDSTQTGDAYTDTFESLPYTSETSKTSRGSSKDYEYGSETFEETGTTTDTSTIRHSILDSLVFPDLSDNETSEVSSARHQFIADTLYRLKHDNIKLDLDLSDIQTQTHTEKKESKHLVKYCQKKIKQLQESRTESGERKQAQVGVKPKPTRVEEYGIGSNTVERIKLRNLMAKMKQRSEEDIHDVKTCPTCCVKLEELDSQQLRTDFLRKNCQKIQSDIIDDKIQNHLIKMNSVNLIAEIIKEIPKLSEDSKETLYVYKQKVASRIKQY